MGTATLILLIVSVTLIFAIVTIGVVANMLDCDWGPDYMRVVAPIVIVLCLFLIGLAVYFEINHREKQLDGVIDTHVDKPRDTITIDGQVYVPLGQLPVTKVTGLSDLYRCTSARRLQRGPISWGS